LEIVPIFEPGGIVESALEPDALRAVIVEDDAASRTILRGMLKKFGIEVVSECAQGRRAVEVVREVAPDVVLVDVGLPDVSGIDVLKAILEFAPEKMVVMITTSSQREVVRAALLGGAVGYIVKPYAIGTLRSTLQRLFPGRALDQ
jgi:two-component system chemotaxis response regulator CheY